jgi:hypothetical protein
MRMLEPPCAIPLPELPADAPPIQARIQKVGTCLEIFIKKG